MSTITPRFLIWIDCGDSPWDGIPWRTRFRKKIWIEIWTSWFWGAFEPVELQTHGNEWKHSRDERAMRSRPLRKVWREYPKHLGSSQRRSNNSGVCEGEERGLCHWSQRKQSGKQWKDWKMSLEHRGMERRHVLLQWKLRRAAEDMLSWVEEWVGEEEIEVMTI